MINAIIHALNPGIFKAVSATINQIIGNKAKIKAKVMFIIFSIPALLARISLERKDIFINWYYQFLLKKKGCITGSSTSYMIDDYYLQSKIFYHIGVKPMSHATQNW
jgi:hypothetical protein